MTAYPTITATVEYIDDLVKIVKKEARAYGADCAEQIIKELRPVREHIDDILKDATNQVYDRRKICTDPSEPLASMCRICPNCTMAIDGAPMCALTRRGLDI